MWATLWAEIKDYLGCMWDLYRMLSGFGMATVMLLAVLVLAWAATRPDPEQRQPPDRVSENELMSLRAEVSTLRGELATERAEKQSLQVDLDALRRSAVWVPPRPPELLPAELIPPQSVPVAPAP